AHLLISIGIITRDSLTRQQTFILSGKWTLSNANASVSLAAEVPGCVHTALQKQGYIQDLYFRFNDLSYRWIAYDNWTYSTIFTASAELRAKEKVLLIFDGVDTVSSIWLNGVEVGSTDNMFRRYDFSVGDSLKDGENELEVRFESPVLYASQRYKAHSAYRVPPECPPEVQKGECHVNFIRKEQRSFSWDWGPSFPTMGLWKEARLVAFDDLHLSQLSSVPLYDANSSQWGVQVDLILDARQATPALIVLSVPELHSQQSFQTRFLPGKTKTTFTLNIKASSSVRLWWPNGHGDQPSYRLAVTGFLDGIVAFKTQSKVYFRTVELIQDPVFGSPGLSFYFRINGKSIFLKGSNWIPAHSFQDQVAPAVLWNLLQSAVDANMNVLRVWGGGVYEQDLFYGICDELGIMVWQDFMFACAMYPTERDFIETVREEIVQQVQRLKSHPSIIVWSGNNENEAALATDWFHIPASQKPLYLKDYVTLYVDNIKRIVEEEDRTRPFLVSSPTNGAESEQEGWVASNPYDPLYGDTHFYSYLPDCWDWRTFPRARFVSEYGFQSWPSFSTLRPVSVKEDWSYSSRFTSHRQHHENGNQQMLQQAALHFTLPDSSDPIQRYTDTLYITQVVMQAQCVKAQTEFYRRSRTELIDGEGLTMGALYWQLNDIWQAPSWASIEFGGKWKMLHYFAHDFFAAVLPVAFEDKGALHIYAVSDLSRDTALAAVVTVHSWADLDSVCTLKSDRRVVPAGSAVAIFQQPVSALLTGCGRCTRFSCLITFHLEDGNGQQGPTNHHFFSKPKEAQGLQRPNITAKVHEDETGYHVTLHAAAAAPFVWLDVGDIPGRFSSNGFLMVSRNRTVTFHAWLPTSVAELAQSLSVRSLRDVY
uniref:Beta-mannosidase n=1 Tax=Tetraodon nigroviridis TaxID=99883 RepID=H3C1U4_TETNG